MRLIPLLLIAFIFPCILLAQWNQIYNASGTGSSIVKSLDYNKDSSIYLGLQGRLLYTVTGMSPVSTYSTNVCGLSTSGSNNVLDFLNKDTGFVGGKESSGLLRNYLLASSNSFATDTCTVPFVAGGSAGFLCGKYLSKDSVLLVQNQGQVSLSTNGGSTWSTNTQPGTGFYAVIGGKTIYYYGFTAWRSSDFGVTKAQIPPFVNVANIVAASFINDSVGFAIKQYNNDYNIIKTTDWGQTWVPLFIEPVQMEMTDLCFLNEDTGYVAGKGFILKTTNGGATWGCQRFTTNFNKITFFDAENGVAAGQNIFNTHIYKTNNGGGTYNPWAYFYLGQVSCCENVICNINNAGPAIYSYSWYLDNALISSSYTPPPIVASSGNHVIKMVISYSGKTDSISRSVYFAPPLSPTVTVNASVDTTICYGGPIFVNLNPSNSSYSYLLKNNTVSLTSVTPGTGGTLALIGGTMDTSFTMTLNAMSPYSHCPGNTIVNTYNMISLPLPADSLLTANVDSICRGNSISVTINNSSPQTQFQLYSGYYNVTPAIYMNFSGSSSDYNYTFLNNQHSRHIFYRAVGANGCVLDTSFITRVVMDSAYSELTTTQPVVITGDTLTVLNSSVDDVHSYYLSSAPTYIDTLTDTLKLFYAANGQYRISVASENDNGCTDNDTLELQVIDTVAVLNSSLCTTFTDGSEFIPYCACWAEQRSKIHVDRFGNIYSLSWTTSGQYTDFRIKKFNSNGTLIYSLIPNHINLPLYNTTVANFIDSDNEGNIYVNGNYFTEGFQLGTKTLSNTFQRSGCFIVKIDSSGAVQWIKNLLSQGIYSSEDMGEIKVANEENIFFSFRDTLFRMDGDGNILDWRFLVRSSYNLHREYVQSSQYFTGISLGPKFEIFGSRVTSLSVFEHPQGSNTGTALYPTGQTDNFGVVAGYLGIYDTSGVFIAGKKIFDLQGTPSSVPYNRPFFDLAQDNSGNLVTCYSPFTYRSNNSIEFGSEYNYSIPGLGVFQDDGDKSLIQKFDADGNVLFTNFSNGSISSITCMPDGKIIGLANYNKYLLLSSSDGTRSGLVGTDATRSSALFCYDSLGNLLWLNALGGNGIDDAYNIVSDRCGENVYFLAGSMSNLSFMGSNVLSNGHYQFYGVDVGGSCLPAPACQWSPWISPGVTTGVGQKMLDEILVYPNPAQSEVFLIMNGAHANALISITDHLGHCVYSGTAAQPSVSIDVRDFPSGMYFIRIVENGQSTVRKLVIE